MGLEVINTLLNDCTVLGTKPASLRVKVSRKGYYNPLETLTKHTQNRRMHEHKMTVEIVCIIELRGNRAQLSRGYVKLKCSI